MLLYHNQDHKVDPVVKRVNVLYVIFNADPTGQSDHLLTKILLFTLIVFK